MSRCGRAPGANDCSLLDIREIMEKEKLSTRTLHHDRRLGTEAGAVHQPIHSSAEFAYPSAQALIDVFQGGPGYTYARQNTPTVASLERHVNMVEQGVGTICFASGMATLTAVFLTLLKNGEDRKSTRLNSSHVAISYAVFCLK